jgi:hypothetical protein
MKMLAAILMGLAVTPAPAVPPAAGLVQRGDQMEALRGRREGRWLASKEIEARIVPTMPGARYLGFDFDPERGIYTLKFLRNGSVIWVEVDGRSGQIIGRTGN